MAITLFGHTAPQPRGSLRERTNAPPPPPPPPSRAASRRHFAARSPPPFPPRPALALGRFCPSAAAVAGGRARGARWRGHAQPAAARQCPGSLTTPTAPTGTGVGGGAGNLAKFIIYSWGKHTKSCIFMTYPSAYVFEGNLRRTQRQPRRVGALRIPSHVCAKEAITVITMMMMMEKRRAMMTGTGMTRWEGSRSATLLGAARRYGEGSSGSTKGTQKEMGLIWGRCSVLTLRRA